MALSQPPLVVERVRSGLHDPHINLNSHRMRINTLDLETTIIAGIRVKMIEVHGATRQTKIKDMKHATSAHGHSVAIVVSKSFWNWEESHHKL